MDSDTQLFQNLVAEFQNSPILRFTKLSLRVQDGMVTIAGRVNSLADRKAVERAAKRVAGITTLILEIRAAALPVAVTDAEGDSRQYMTLSKSSGSGM
jgi:osmotically-inducible protein OsmY